MLRKQKDRVKLKQGGPRPGQQAPGGKGVEAEETGLSEVAGFSSLQYFMISFFRN